MHDAALPTLTEWSNFYVITGSSAAALTGLVFIVITLVAGNRAYVSSEGIGTFTSPTIIHFCVALFISVTLSAPWHAVAPPCLLCAATGLFGLCYMTHVIGLARRMREYRVGLDDWVWYALLPLLAYLVLLPASVLLASAPERALLAIAGTIVFLIFIGIHNSWDVVTYITVARPQGPEGSEPGPSANSGNETSPAQTAGSGSRT